MSEYEDIFGEVYALEESIANGYNPSPEERDWLYQAEEQVERLSSGEEISIF